MKPEALASQALVSWISQQIPSGIPDIVCQGLPPLDVKYLLTGLKALSKQGLDTGKVSLALDGFDIDEAGLNKVANTVGYKAHNGLADSLFIAARWRNDHRKYPTIIALSAGHERLVNTLQHFKRPGVRDLVRALFDWAKSDDGRPAPHRMMLMLQTLLAERFNVKVRRETREDNVFALVVVKGTPRLRTPRDTSRSRVGTSQGSTAPGTATTITTGQNASMQQLAQYLSNRVHRPVADQTGLAGNYDFSFEYAYDDSATNTAAPFLTALQDATGLKLNVAKGPVDFLVVDRADKPSAN